MKYTILATAIIAGLLVGGNSGATIQEDIAARNKQIEELQRQIAEYQRQIVDTSGKAATLSGEIARLNAQIGKIQLEIRSLNLSINQTDGEITVTQRTIGETQSQIDTHKLALSRSLLELYESDQQNLTEVLLGNGQLSDFFNSVKIIDDIHSQLRADIAELKSLKGNLEEKEGALVEKRDELQQLRALQESQKKTLDQSKGTKDKLLKVTKGEEAKYQQLVKQSQQQIDRIREQVYYLQQVGVSVEDAIKYGQLAAKKLGIRPGFLIAVLEVESRLGKNVGTGNWKDDMYLCYLRLADLYPSKKQFYTKRAEDEKAAFFSVINKLGLNVDTVKVSREPSYGCGGAMGPAQFIPTTWLAYEAEVSKNTGHAVANPWNIEDAFMAAAIKLARGGAALGTRDGEIRASKAYISGNASCTSSICNYYANLVQDKAAIIEQNLHH